MFATRNPNIAAACDAAGEVCATPPVATPRPMPHQESHLMQRFEEFRDLPSASRFRRLQAAMESFQLLHFPD